MAEQDWPSDTALRVVVTGGDRLHRPTRAQPWRLYNTYGPNETTILVTRYLVTPGPAGDDYPSVGWAIDNARLHVLDRDLNLQPPAVPGELSIGGVQVGRGYVGAPAHTAERFVPDPFGPPGSVLYRTGDRVRLRADGSLDFLGRIDQQVKIRGFRVEPGEIESVLRAHPRVRDAAVITRDNPRGERQLVAYVAGPGGEPDIASIRGHLRRELPDYMVPGHIVTLSELPVTPNGKLDRAGLPPVAELADPVPGRPAPDGAEGTVEEAVAGAWRAVLGVDHIPADNFFEAGGSSLLLTTLADRLRTTFDIPVALVDVFANPTVATQAQLVSALTGSTGGPEPADEPADEDLPAPARRARRSRLAVEVDLDDDV